MCFFVLERDYFLFDVFFFFVAFFVDFLATFFFFAAMIFFAIFRCRSIKNKLIFKSSW